jgi:hypothetical protein
MSEMSEVEIKRCRGDPIYRLFFYPDYENFIDKLMLCATQVIEKRYGSRLMKSPIIARITGLLNDVRMKDTHQVKVVALLFIIHWETSLTHAVAEMFSNEEETLFGADSKAHFYKFMSTIAEFVDKTLKHPYNKTNSMQTIGSFFKSARQEYMTH